MHRLFVTKAIALILAILLVQGHISFAHPEGAALNRAEEDFAAALKDYRKGLYESAAAKLEKILKSQEESAPGFTAKVYLVLGAGYEKSGKGEKARECYLALKKVLDDGAIDHIPAVTGVETADLSLYREVLGETFFKFKKPVPASEMIKQDAIHAPKKSIKKKEKEKRKKRFPWLLAGGAVLIVATVLVLLLKKKPKPAEIPEIDWVRIPAGEFLMGDNFDEGDADELPVHRVYLDEYYISKYEVSFPDYNLFCADTGRTELPIPEPFLYGHRSEKPLGPAPIHTISWHDANAFCNWLSQKTGENIRLPTEAQWEKAARGTYQYRYPWGDIEPKCIKSNYLDCTGHTPHPYNPIGYRPDGMSPYGVYEMAGNMAEWCRDWYSASYYSISPEKNPAGPSSGSYRVIRGGGYLSPAADIRSASRDHQRPEKAAGYIGFRLVKEQ